MSEEYERRLHYVECKLDHLSEYMHARPIHEPRSDLEQLYISPRSILVFVTMVNIALFIGGTVYTGVQVDSIQKRYAEASTKILEAQQKYDASESKLKAIQTILTDTQRQSAELLADVRNRSSENSSEISKIKEESELQLRELKQRSASIITSMSAYQKDTEAALEKASNDVAEKIEQKIQFNKDAIQGKQAEIDELELQIKGLSANVSVKNLELEKIQRALDDHLAEANRLNVDFAEKIKSITRTDRLTIPLAYELTDPGLKLLFGIPFLACFVLAFLKFRRQTQ